MKNILESQEIFKAYSQIDLLMYFIDDIQSQVKFFETNRTQLDAMIDKATGKESDFIQEKLKDLDECYDQLIPLFKLIEHTDMVKSIEESQKLLKEKLERLKPNQETIESLKEQGNDGRKL